MTTYAMKTRCRWRTELQYLLWMVDDTGDLLAVTLQNGNDLLGVLVEDHRVFVVTTCESETERHIHTYMYIQVMSLPPAKVTQSVIQTHPHTGYVQIIVNTSCTRHVPVTIRDVSRRQTSSERIPGILALCKP